MLKTKKMNKKQKILTICVFAISANITAQNASYDANNIPISGTDCSAFGKDALKINGVTGIANSALGHSALSS